MFIRGVPKVVPGYKDAARSRIAEAAAKVFSSKGYRDATMDDIAAELGVSKGAIYLYFKSKEDLLSEISQHSQSAMMGVLENCFRSNDLEEAAEETFKLIFQKRQTQLKMLFEMTGLATHDEKIRRVQKENQERYLDTMLEFLRAQVRKGTLQEGKDTREIAAMMAALYMGMARMLVLGYESSELHRAWKQSFLMILRAKPEAQA